jgi:hypothetical protein
MLATPLMAKSAHGVLAANNGATVAESEAIFDWQGGVMASFNTRAADRAHLAKGASSAERLANNLSPHLVEKGGIRREKKNDIRCLGIRWWGR